MSSRNRNRRNRRNRRTLLNILFPSRKPYTASTFPVGVLVKYSGWYFVKLPSGDLRTSCGPYVDNLTTAIRRGDCNHNHWYSNVGFMTKHVIIDRGYLKRLNLSN